MGDHLMTDIYDIDTGEVSDAEVCTTCAGLGGWSLGDCEDGVWETCDDCEGTGLGESWQ